MPSKGFKKRIAMGLGFAGALMAIFYLLVFLRVKPAKLTSELQKTLSAYGLEELEYENFELSHFPFLEVSLKEAKFRWGLDRGIAFRAPLLRLRIHPWLAIFGKTAVAQAQIKDGSFTLMKGSGEVPSWCMVCDPQENTWTFSGLQTTLSAHQGLVKGEASLSDQAHPGKAFMHGQGTVDFKKGTHWNPLEIKGGLTLEKFSLAQRKFFWNQREIQTNAGSGNGFIQFLKKTDSPWLELNAGAKFEKVIYQIPLPGQAVSSPELDLTLTSEISVSPTVKDVHLRRAQILSSAGDFEISGRYLGETGEIKEGRITGARLFLEALPQYWLPFREAIPVNFGFSGASSFEATAEGAAHEISLHGIWELSPMVLTYARFFSKPKGKPLSLGWDLKLKDRTFLSGDFSVKFAESTFKGTLNRVDLKSGFGQANLITNKFSLQGWESFVPVLEKYRLAGEAKCLINLEGWLTDFRKTKPMFNFTLERGRLSIPTGPAVEEIDLLMDYTPMAIEVKKAAFRFGETKLEGNFWVSQPHGSVSVRSVWKAERLEPAALLKGAQALTGDWIPERYRPGIEEAIEFLDYLFPQNQSLEGVEAKVEVQNSQLKFKDLNFDFEDGDVSAEGVIDYSAAEPVYTMTVEADRIRLSKFFERRGLAGVLAGNLFFNGRFEGAGWDTEDWTRPLKASGTFSLTNGEWSSVDLLETLSRIKIFSVLEEFATAKTSFDDLRSDFEYTNGKMIHKNLMMISKDFHVEGKGDIAKAGVLNYRLNVFLQPTLAQRIVGEKKFVGKEGEIKQFGPLPFLLAGPLDKPELQPDPEELAQFLEDFERNKTQRVFRTFLAEDLFFDPRKNS